MNFLEKYKRDHQHPINKLLHSFGIPMIVVSLPLVLYSWKWALALFIAGWILQFVGHWFEGVKPSFFRIPFFSLWVLCGGSKKSLGFGVDSEKRLEQN